nr:TetR/AcrR family transcriptional regulator [Nostoc sp. CmiVER01]
MIDKSTSRLPRSDKRARILAAAREILAQRRYEDAAVSEIVKRANVAQGTFYRYFPSKTALVSALAEELQRDITQAVEQIATENQPLDKSLEALIRAALAAATPYRDILGILDTEALLFGSSSSAEERREPYLQQLILLIKRDQACGRISSNIDPAIAIRLVGSILDRMARDCLLYHPEIAVEHYLAETVGFVRRALGMSWNNQINDKQLSAQNVDASVTQD